MLPLLPLLPLTFIVGTASAADPTPSVASVAIPWFADQPLYRFVGPVKWFGQCLQGHPVRAGFGQRRDNRPPLLAHRILLDRAVEERPVWVAELERQRGLLDILASDV